MALFTWLQSITGRGTSLRQPSVDRRAASQHSTVPTLRPGDTVSADFLHHHERVHSICRVEKQIEARLRLYIVSEVGRASLLGLRNGTPGHIEINNSLSPFRVTYLDFPCVEVVTSPHQTHPAHRQLLRVPASFLVRLRRKVSTGLWVSGQGIDISAGGCRIMLTAPLVPKIRDSYAVDMLITLPNGSEDRPLLDTEVRWVRPTSSGIYVGIEALHPTQRTVLTNTAVQFQQALARRPKEYVLARS